MNVLAQQKWAEVILPWLRETSLHVAVLVVLVLLIQRLFRNQLSAQSRCALWLIVVIRLLMPMVPESPLSIYNLGFWKAWSAPLHKPIVASAPIHPIGYYKYGYDRSGRLASTQDDQKITKYEYDENEKLQRVIEVSPSGEVLTKPPFVNAKPKSQFTWQTKIVFAWIVGLLLCGGYFIFCLFVLLRKLRSAQKISCPQVLSLLEECRITMDVRQRVVILETSFVRSPAVCGVLAPKILLPPGLLAQFHRNELRHILLHELAHIKRGDLWQNWLMAVVQIIYWFNPIVWFAFACLRADRELACDELALIRSGEAHGQSYGYTLLKLLENVSRTKTSPVLVGIVEGRQQMAQRLSRIAAFRLPSRWSRLAVPLFWGLSMIGLTGARTPVTPEANEKTPARFAKLSMIANEKGQGNSKTASFASLTNQVGQVLHGKVLEAGNRKPVTDFVVQWETNDGLNTYVSAPVEFHSEGGRYSIPISKKSARFIVTISASGFEATEMELTDAHLRQETEVFLKEGTDFKGRIVCPDGKPAIGATIAFFSPKNNPRIANRSFEIYPRVPMMQTDGKGLFRHSWIASCDAISVLHEQGYAKVKIDDFSKNPVIRLEPWGRIEGILRFAGKPAVGQEVRLRSFGSGPELSLKFFQVVTDESGRFAFDSVPPGKFTLSRWVPASPINLRPNIFLHTNHATNVVVMPGETVTVSLGGDGASVVGQVSLQGKRPDWKNTYLFASLEKNLGVDDQKNDQDIKETEEPGRAITVGHSYSFAVKEDGTIEAPDIPPGTYQLNMEAKQNFVPRGEQVSPSRLKLLATLKKEIVIPEPTNGKPAVFDLGNLVLLPPGAE